MHDPALEPPDVRKYINMTEEEKDEDMERARKHLRATIKEILDAKQNSS